MKNREPMDPVKKLFYVRMAVIAFVAVLGGAAVLYTAYMMFR